MSEYQLHKMRQDELLREAASYRLAKAAKASRKATRAGRRRGEHDPEGQVSHPTSLRRRFARAA